MTYGKAQADNFFNTIAEHFEGDYGELPPVIDLEHRRTGISGECRVKCYRALLDRTAELWNQAPMIYTAGWYWDTYVHPYVGDWKYWEEHELWEADPPPDTPIKGWVDGGVVLQVALSSPLDGWKDPKGYQGKVDINETEDSWLAKHWQPIPPPNCEEEVTKALAAQKIIYEKEIARLQDENAQLQIDVYNQALDDVKGTINNMYKE
ncbi:MAG: hypothetical protein GWN76_08495 [candidate division Zixibacteria bacterium]|nr:hypothetical protein [candidate division Zixibacteria bacterium]NIU14037.1 hypothetical protein [candidate division Zixibacteria bacterium]